MTDQPGVVLARDDGVIPVDTGIPWPAQLAAQIERTMAAVLGPRDDTQPERTEDET